MNIFVRTAIVVFALALVGCSGVDHLGNVGNVELYSVHATEAHGPNFTAFVSRRVILNEEGEEVEDVTVEAIFSGPGPLTGSVNAALGAAAQVGGAYAFGANLRPPKYNSTTNITGVSGASSDQGQGQGQGQLQGQKQGQHASVSSSSSSSSSLEASLSNSSTNTNSNNSSASATATGGDGGDGGDGGGGFVPPGHQD